MKLNKKNGILLLILAVAMLLAFIGLSGGLNQVSPTPNAQENIQEGSSGVYPVKGGTAVQAKLYTQLVQQYSTRRIQFDAMCQAIPNNVTYKNGTSVMFDNRSGDARWIKVGATSYYFAGYGYKILTLSSSVLPKTLLLSCGAAVNVGQILIQH